MCPWPDESRATFDTLEGAKGALLKCLEFEISELQEQVNKLRDELK